jgi:hypothetical protein
VPFHPEIQAVLTNHHPSNLAISHPVVRSSVGNRVGKIGGCNSYWDVEVSDIAETFLKAWLSATLGTATTQHAGDSLGGFVTLGLGKWGGSA